MITEQDAVRATIAFLKDCEDELLTLREVRTLMMLSLAMDVPLDKLLDKIKASSSMRDKLNDLSE